MNRRPDGTSCTPFTRANTGSDPVAVTIDDSIWLGGEAMVAPGGFFDLHASDWVPDNGNVDPCWLAI